jgi:hypothetical protein
MDCFTNGPPTSYTPPSPFPDTILVTIFYQFNFYASDNHTQALADATSARDDLLSYLSDQSNVQDVVLNAFPGSLGAYATDCGTVSGTSPSIVPVCNGSDFVNSDGVDSGPNYMYADSFQCSAETAPTPPPPESPPPAPVTCNYSGTYQIYSVVCTGQLVSASADCTKNNVYLRFPSQSPGHRSHWDLDTSVVVGSNGSASAIISEARSTNSCPSTQLACSQHAGIPVLGGPVWNLNVIPVDDTCTTVWLEGLTSEGASLSTFMSTNVDCSGFGQFQPASGNPALQFSLVPAE